LLISVITSKIAILKNYHHNEGIAADTEKELRQRSPGLRHKRHCHGHRKRTTPALSTATVLSTTIPKKHCRGQKMNFGSTLHYASALHGDGTKGIATDSCKKYFTLEYAI